MKSALTKKTHSLTSWLKEDRQTYSLLQTKKMIQQISSRLRTQKAQMLFIFHQQQRQQQQS